MADSRGLLYPAFHKFYSALNALEKFEKGTNFFDNIAYLDNFFSEYRNITFVLQKSLAHTQYKAAYENLRDHHLVNDVCKWFIDKRNEVLKQQPFDLEKRIAITIYSDQIPVHLPELIFSIENDVNYSTVIDSLRETFMKADPLEVMFSAEFSFFERGHNEDLYDNFISGIGHMKLFMEAMKSVVGETCKICDGLEKKIEAIKFYRVPKNLFLIDDYVYFCKKDRFEKASRVELAFGPDPIRSPIENLNKTYPEGDLFTKFELMHLVNYQMQKTLLPTCMLIYEDGTFELLTFGGTIKTIFYRKFNEIARRIEVNGIVNVLYVTEMYVYDPKIMVTMDSRERIKHAQNEVLSFFMVDKDLVTRSHSYNTRKIHDFNYIAKIMHTKSGLSVPPGFMNPVILEFAKIKAKNVKVDR